MTKIQLIEESIGYNINIKNDKMLRRKAIVEFLYPLWDELQEKVNGFSYSFRRDLLINIRVKSEKEKEIREITEKRIEDTEYLDEYKFNRDPWRAGWGDTETDKEILIKAKETLSVLAMKTVNMKYNEESGKSIDDHATRYIHIFLDQMATKDEDEIEIYLDQLISRLTVTDNLSEKQNKKILEEMTGILDKYRNSTEQSKKYILEDKIPANAELSYKNYEKSINTITNDIILSV